MILTHLFYKISFERYVNSLPYSDDIFFFDDTYDPLNDKFIKLAIRDSKWLGHKGFDNPQAIIEKIKLTKKVLNYMTKWDMYYPEILENFLSTKTPNYEAKIDKLEDELHDKFILRYRYLEAFRELRKSGKMVERLNTQFSKNASANFVSNYSTSDYDTLLRAHESLDHTSKFEGLEQEGVMSMRNLGIHIHQSAKRLIDDSSSQLSDEQLLGVWICESEKILTNSNLKRLGDLLCVAYKNEFATEIKEYRDELKKAADRNRFTPTQKYSKADKNHLIKKYKANGLTHSKIAKKLGINISTVTRHLKIFK